MAATTPIYALPYPVPADPADVPADIQALANRLEAVLPGAGGFSKIADQTLGASATTIDFASIPQTFAHLLLFSWLRTDAAAAIEGANVRFNGDSAASYDYQYGEAAGASVTAVANTGGAVTSLQNASLAPGGTATASMFGGGLLLIPNYRGASNKALIALAAHKQDNTPTMRARLIVGFWRSNVAINRVTILPNVGPNFVAGSRVGLYGLT